jgi:hypothetical protein
MFLKMLRPVGKEAAKKGVRGFVASKKLPNRVVKGFVGEGLQEDAQTLWQNAVAKYGYDETQELAEGLVESFIGGAGMGGIAGVALSPGKTTSEKYDKAVAKLKRQGATDEDIGKFTDSVVNDLNQMGEKYYSNEEGEFLGKLMTERPQGPLPIDPEAEKIDKRREREKALADATGTAIPTDLVKGDENTAKKTANDIDRLDADTNANALKAAEARLEEERLAAVPANLKLYKADLEAGTATIDDIEGYGVTQEDIDADNTRREAIAAKDSAQKEKAGADKARAKAEVTFKEHRAETDEHLKGETLNGMMLDVVEDDGDTKKNVQADAGEVLRESNKLEDIMTEIKGCLGGK